MTTNPTEEDIYSPEFEAVWNAIKDWDLWHEAEGDIPAGYGGATGKDVMTILSAVRSTHICWKGPEIPPSVKKPGADLTLQFFKGCNPKLGHYNIGSTKILMIGPIRVFVSRGNNG